MAGNGKVALTWQAPSSTGGSPITGYGVDYSSNAGATWSTALAPSAKMTATSYTVTGLTNGTAYVFRVVAANASGTGPWSATSAAYTPHTTVPGAPTGVAGSNATSTSVDRVVDASGGQRRLGDRQVLRQRVDRWWRDMVAVRVPATLPLATTLTWTGLTPNTSYLFRVYAHTSAGMEHAVNRLGTDHHLVRRTVGSAERGGRGGQRQGRADLAGAVEHWRVAHHRLRGGLLQ